MKSIRFILLGFLFVFILTAGTCDENDNQYREENQEPVAIISSLPAGINGFISATGPLQVVFDASQSYDPDDCEDCRILEYMWDLDGNGTFDYEGKTASFIYPPNSDFYQVRLKVVDNFEKESEALLTIESLPAPFEPFVQGNVIVPPANEPFGKTTVACPVDDNLLAYITGGDYATSCITNSEGHFIIENLASETDYFLVAGFSDYSDGLVMNADLSDFNADMDYYDILQYFTFPLFHIDAENQVIMQTPVGVDKDSIPITLSQAIILLDENGNDWEEDPFNPVEITFPYTFKWECQNDDVWSYVFAIIRTDENSEDDVFGVYPQEVEGEYIPAEELANQELTVSDLGLEAGTYKFLVMALRFDPNNEEMQGGPISYSELLNGDFTISEVN